MKIETLTTKQQETLARLALAFTLLPTMSEEQIKKVADLRTAKSMVESTRGYTGSGARYTLRAEYAEYAEVMLAMLQLETPLFGTEIYRKLGMRTPR